MEARAKHPATAATALHRPFGSFSFFGEGCGDPLLLLPGRGPVPVCWRSGLMASRTATAPASGLRGGGDTG
jgi:hypothetical protein